MVSLGTGEDQGVEGQDEVSSIGGEGLEAHSIGEAMKVICEHKKSGECQADDCYHMEAHEPASLKRRGGEYSDCDREPSPCEEADCHVRCTEVV